MAGAHEVPFTPWDAFLRSWVWRQGEHVTIIGPTGTGKTTLMRALMTKRYEAGGAVAVLATKPKDRNLEAWARADHLAIVDDWPPRPPLFRRPPEPAPGVRWDHRLMVWPRGGKSEDRRQLQADVHQRALREMFWEGDWCIAAEELLYMCDRLGLSSDLIEIWTQGRSNNVTIIGASQRPVDIPLYAYSQATHLFMFGDNDEVNLRRLQGIGGMSGAKLQQLVRTLPFHDVLYIGTRGRQLVRTRVPIHQGGTRA